MKSERVVDQLPHSKNMKTEIWQTTNLQPWVEAIACGLITCKTRTSRPTVPVGAVVFLHSSKSRLWPWWKHLSWTKDLNPKTWERGKIVAIARVENVGRSVDVMTKKESHFWDVRMDSDPMTFTEWNCVADYTVRFKDIVRLKIPVAVQGFQAPFAHAKQKTIVKVLKANPELKSYLNV